MGKGENNVKEVQTTLPSHLQGLGLGRWRRREDELKLFFPLGGQAGDNHSKLIYNNFKKYINDKFINLENHVEN